MNYSENDFKWHGRFLALAEHVAQWSKDPSTKVGAVLVSPDRSRTSLGYNGFPRRMDDSPALYADREEKYSRVVHAEINAMINAGCDVHGWTLYTWPFLTCDRCAVQMIQAGLFAVIAPKTSPELEVRWGEAMVRTRSFYAEAGVHVRELEVSYGV